MPNDTTGSDKLRLKLNDIGPQGDDCVEVWMQTPEGWQSIYAYDETNPKNDGVCHARGPCAGADAAFHDKIVMLFAGRQEAEFGPADLQALMA